MRDQGELIRKATSSQLVEETFQLACDLFPQVVPKVTAEEIRELQEERKEVIQKQLEAIEEKRQAKLLRVAA